MKILIKDATMCVNCQHRTCSMGDVVERVLFARFKTERYTCPVRYLQTEPTDEQIEAKRIDLDDPSHEGSGLQCIHCGLCVLKCVHENLSIDSAGTDRFRSFIDCSCSQNDKASNILALSFLNSLFDFAANTNLNKALLFDGLVCDDTGRRAFVEVDVGDDSLESCRRLLGDIVQYNFKNQKNRIDTGLMVLKTIPKAGSRDVITLLEKMLKFPGTAEMNIFITTFDLLRIFTMKFKKNQYSFEQLFYNAALEDCAKYSQRMKEYGVAIADLKVI